MPYHYVRNAEDSAYNKVMYTALDKIRADPLTKIFFLERDLTNYIWHRRSRNNLCKQWPEYVLEYCVMPVTNDSQEPPLYCI